MKTKHISALITKNAQTINQLHAAITQTAKNKASDPQAWKKATAAFHASYDSLAFPGGLEKGLQLLKEQDPATIHAAIDFLHADPYFFRSGYIKQKLVRLLKQATLSVAQKEELKDILNSAIKNKSQ